MVTIDGVNYLTVSEACALLSVKPATIYAYVSRGVLRSYKQGIKRQRLYREDEVMALLAIQPGASALPEPVHDMAPAPREEADEPLPPAEGWMSEV